MKKSADTDRQCIEKVQSYINDIGEILKADNISSADALKNTLAAKYAITQLVTNIYELSRKLQDETLNKLENFNSPVLRKARQISSHDYEAVDFRSIYNLCTQLTGKIVQDELKNCM
jgi:hypothetical protein